MRLLGTVKRLKSKIMFRMLSSATEMTLLLFLRLRKENGKDIVDEPVLWNGIPQRIKLVEKQ